MTNFLEKDRLIAAGYFLKEGGYTDCQIETVTDQYYKGQIMENNALGFMNYSFSLPVSITAGKWSLLLSYTHNIPVELPGEDFDYPNNGYFSTSLGYFIYWKKS